MELNGTHLIRLAHNPSREDCLAAFWEWVAILARDDYTRAVEALYWPDAQRTMTPTQLKEQIKTFFGGDKPWSVVIPNERLVGEINKSLEHDLIRYPGSSFWTRRVGWFQALIPLTNEPTNPLDDKIPLMGLGIQFIVPQYRGSGVLEFGIFMA